MKNKTLLTFIFLLSLGCLLMTQNYFDNQETFLKSVQGIQDDICSDVNDGQSSKSQISDANRLRNQLLSMNKKIGIDVIIENFGNLTSQQQTDAISASSIILVPWAILFTLAIVSYLSLLICFADCCSCGCKKAETISHIKLSIALSFICCLIILGFCVFGFIMSFKVNNSIQSWRCAGIFIFDDINNGVSDSENKEIQLWKGLNSVLNNITDIQNGLFSLVSDTQQQLDSIDAQQLQDQYADLSNENEKLQNVPLTTYYGTNKILGYISTGQAISSNEIKTELNELQIIPQQEIFKNIYENIIKEIVDIKIYGQQLNDQEEDIRHTLNDTKLSIEETKQDLSQVANRFFDDTSILGNTSKIAQQSLLLVFGIFGLFTLIIILTLLTVWFVSGISCLQNLLICSCTCNCLFVLIGCILCGGLGLTGAVLSEGCDYFDVALTNQTAFEKLQNRINDQEASDLMIECLFKEGDILNYYNVYDSLTQAIDLDNSINQFSQKQQEFISNSKKGDAILKSNSDYITSFFSFERVDEQEYIIQSDSSNMKYVMREQLKTCNNNKKSSVPDKMTYCDQSAIQYSALSGGQFSNPNNDPVCFQSAIFSVDQKLLNQQIQDCPEIEIINQFFTSQTNQWKSVQAQETIILNKHNSNQNELVAKFDIITEYTTKASSYLNQITDKNTGALSGVNCKFIKASITDVQNLVCVKSFKLSYQIWICISVITILTWLSSFCIFRVIIGLKNIFNFDQANLEQSLLKNQGQAEFYWKLKQPKSYEN